MRLPSWFNIIVGCRSSEYPHHVSVTLFTHILPGTLYLQVRRIAVEAKELLRFEVCIDLKPNDIFRLFDLVSTNYQRATILSILNFLRLGLILGKCKCQLQALM